MGEGMSFHSEEFHGNCIMSCSACEILCPQEKVRDLLKSQCDKKIEMSVELRAP